MIEFGVGMDACGLEVGTARLEQKVDKGIQL